jgi:tetratricopeptide (TPR) repeat protein
VKFSCLPLIRAIRAKPFRALAVGALCLLLAVGSWMIGVFAWSESHYQAARRALEADDLESAFHHLQECLKVWPRSVLLHHQLARVAWRLGREEEAVTYLTECQQLSGVTKATKLEWALIRAQRGDLLESQEYLYSLAEENHPESAAILEAMSLGYTKNHQFGNALAVLSKWLELQPDNLRALSAKGSLLVQVSRPDEALEVYRRILELAPGRDDAREQLASLLLSFNRAEEALRFYERLQEKHPESRDVRLGIAMCRHQLGQTEEARALLDQILAEDPDHVLAMVQRGQVAMLDGQFARAETILRHAVGLEPSNHGARYQLYQCLSRRGRKKEAAAELAKLKQLEVDSQRLRVLTGQLNQDSQNPAILCEVGVILLRQGGEKEGVQWLYGALKRDPNFGPAHEALIDYYLGKGDLEMVARHRQVWKREGTASPSAGKEGLAPRAPAPPGSR